MFWWLLLASLQAAELQIDARMPAEIIANGKSLGQMLSNTKATISVNDHLSQLVVMTQGNPHTVDVDFTSGPVQLFIGKTGITAGPAPVVLSEPAARAVVEFRSASDLGILFIVDGKRHTLKAHDRFEMELPVGEHPFDLRNSDGTLIWSTGTIRLNGTGKLLMQLSDGRMPEFTGSGGEYLLDSP